MYGLTRGTMTLIGVAAAGALLWLGSQFDGDANGDYWVQMGLVAGAGLVMALSQLLGGWTKWGWPRLSATVFLLGFLPALAAGGLVLLTAQPDSSAFGAGWAADLGLEGLAEDFAAVLPAVAFLIGLTFGFAFDTTGPVVDTDEDEVVDEPHAYPVDRRATDEPVTAERHALRRDRETAGGWDDTRGPARASGSRSWRPTARAAARFAWRTRTSARGTRTRARATTTSAPRTTASLGAAASSAAEKHVLPAPGSPGRERPHASASRP